MAATAEYFSVTMEELQGANRSRTLVNARQIAMYLCRELTELSLPRIGASFGGKDHTTVMHAVKKITNLMRDRKSTRLNSSHANISYAVFCLKKKKMTR